MKILFTVHDLQKQGGTETFTYTVMEKLIGQGHNLFLYSTRLGDASNRFSKLGVTVSDDFKNFPTEIDIIHAQHIAEAFAAYTAYPSTPMIFITHGIIPWQEMPLKIPNVYKYVAVSEEVEAYLMNSHSIIKERIQIIRNPINLERFKVENSFNTVPSKLLLLSNRYTDEVKETLIELCELTNMDLEIVGKEKNVSNVEEQIQNSDIVVSLGRGILEATACGKGAIVFDYNGGDGILTPENYSELREKNFSGRTHKQNFSANQLRELIIGNYNEDNIKRNILLIKENHDVDQIASEFEKLYALAIEWSKEQNFEYVPVPLKAFSDFYKHIGREIVQKEKNVSYLFEVIDELEKVVRDKDENINKLNIYIKELIDQRELKELEIINWKGEMENNLNQLIEQLRLKDNDLIYHKSELENNYQIKKISDEKLVELQKEVVQKENNTIYLMGLNGEKNKELEQIYNSKAWELVTKYRVFKRRIIKATKNPKWAIRKVLQLKPKLDMKHVQKEQNINIVNTNDNPLVSIVIPIYDRTDVLIQSIESILNQTYKNIELLLVCDGSPDATLDIVKSYEHHDKVRAFYFYNNSGNAVRGRNKAITEAKGTFLAFQDSDDIAELDRIEISLNYIKQYNADIVYGGWRAIVDGSREIDIKDGQEVLSPDCDYNLLSEICVPCQSTVMAKMSALLDVGGLKTTMRYREDHELWLRLSYFGYKFKAIPQILTNLRLHNNNLELSFKTEDDHWLQLMMEEHRNKEKIKPKIAYVIPGCGISGGIAVICQHANRLLSRGYDVILITEDDKVKIDWFPNQKVQIMPLSECPDNLDIVVATGWSTAYTVQNIPAKRRIYFVQSDESRFHEYNSRDYKLTIDTYKLNMEYMTEAKWIQKWLKEKFDQNSYYVPNGLDENIIYQVNPIIPKSSKVRVLLEGPIDIPYKGMKEAFEAVHDLDCEVWCISSAGRPKEDWKCDYFFEKVPMEKMREIYSSCDILLKMSTVEGFFGPPLEMMACGGSCVVTEVSGYDEYIVDGYNALTIPLNDVEAARLAVKKLIEDSELREKLVNNGKTTVSQWKWEPTIDKLESIINK